MHFEDYRGLLYSAQNVVKKDPNRDKQKSLATAVANFTKPGAQNKGDLCMIFFCKLAIELVATILGKVMHIPKLFYHMPLTRSIFLVQLCH